MSGLRNVIIFFCVLMFFFNQSHASARYEFVGHVNALDNGFVMYDAIASNGRSFLRDNKIIATYNQNDSVDLGRKPEKYTSVSLRRSSDSVFLTSESGEHYAMRNIMLNSVVLAIVDLDGNVYVNWVVESSSGCTVESAGNGGYHITFKADECNLVYRSEYSVGKKLVFQIGNASFSFVSDDNVRALSSGQYLGSTIIEPMVINMMGKEQLRMNPFDMSFRLVKNDKERILRVKFPPGADVASLIPLGGWSKWINSNIVPASIYRDIPFNITTTGAFSIRRFCIIQSCRFKDEVTGSLPASSATFSITLPSPYTYKNSRVDRILITDAKVIIEGDKTGNVTSGRGKLRVSANAISKLFSKPGTTWSTQATIVFDSEITSE